jgi:hypothetical protein
MKISEWIEKLEQPGIREKVKEKIRQAAERAYLADEEACETFWVCLYENEEVHIKHTHMGCEPEDNENDLEYLIITSFDTTYISLKPYLDESVDLPEYDINLAIKILKQQEELSKEKENKKGGIKNVC